jgi:site-specific DNA recombinase
MQTSESKMLISEEEPVKRSVRLLRVSSKSQTDTDADVYPYGNSIDTQRKVTIAKEKAMGTVNVGEYVEPGYSGQLIQKRPFFKKLLHRIRTERDVDYVVIYMRSRVFRNYVEAVGVTKELEQLSVKIISAKEDFGDGFMAEAMTVVTDVFNWLQVKMSGQDIAIKMSNKARNGGTINHAKLGYRNDTKTIDGHKVNTISLDTERSGYVRKAFELAATGQHTLNDLHEQLADAGFTMPAMGRWPQRPVSRSTLAHLLRDRYYLGEIYYQGIWYPAGTRRLLIMSCSTGYSGSLTPIRALAPGSVPTGTISRACCGAPAARAGLPSPAPWATAASTSTSCAGAGRTASATCRTSRSKSARTP